MDPNNDNREAITKLLEGCGEIGGRFNNLKRIDNGTAGHFSALLSATDTHSGRKVALKFLLPLFHSDVYRYNCFMREATLLLDFQGHPDIIQLIAPHAVFNLTLKTEHGLDIPVQCTYYALELAQIDLGTIIATENWGAERLLVAFRSMCRAVQRIHAKGVVHRDLKPPNFLVMYDNTIRLSDFGTARQVIGSAPSLGNYAAPPGDIRYSPPEMLALLHDHEADIAIHADFFALGAILFEMFSGTNLGQRLYDAAFVGDLMQAMANVKPAERRRVFDLIATTIADARQIPSVSLFGSSVPACIAAVIDDLVKRLAALDYRRRLCNFTSIFNRVNVCLLVLRNEGKYRRWLAEKHRRRVERRLLEGR